MERKLEGQTIVVVGASSGVGRAVVEVAAAGGAKVVMLSRSADKLAAAAEGIESVTYRHPVDMRNAKDVEAALSAYDCIDHLVLTAVADENARAKPIIELDGEDLERSFDKLRGYFTVIKATASRLLSTGSVTMMCGAAALRPPATGFSLLAAEGAAIPGMARALARELSPVRVNVIMAGVVDTPIHDNDREAIASWAETSLPTRRFGQPSDIADAIIFAMGNPYFTGATLTIDGGLSIT
ncbi:MAG: SDR family oxidoreductase [Neoaquamicrobium sediminum]|uniref:SDR family oxidoreductase n=1 Tax=Neoaquamicrobium sediminum TaxID=1849104 RepID=UPI0040370057